MPMIEDNDYTLPAEQKSVWLSVEAFSVYVHKTDEGVVVDIFPLGDEMVDPIASTYAFWSESDVEDLD